MNDTKRSATVRIVFPRRDARDSILMRQTTLCGITCQTVAFFHAHDFAKYVGEGIGKGVIEPLLTAFPDTPCR